MFPLVRIVVAAAFVLIPMIAIQAIVRALHLPKPVQMPLLALLVVPAVVLMLRAYTRLIERRDLHEFSTPGALPELGGGVLLGAALFAAVAAILAAMGALRITPGLPAAQVLPNLIAMAALTSVSEEVLVRGIIFRISEVALGSWMALVLSAALFGLGHIGNPGADVWSAAAIAIEAGILLAASYLLTRRLWLPIGLHAGWNFTEAGVFGAATSGNELPGLLKSVTVGPKLISGGAFGAEASIVAVLLCLAAGIVLITMAARRGRIVAPPWRAGARASAVVLAVMAMQSCGSVAPALARHNPESLANAAASKEAFAVDASLPVPRLESPALVAGERVVLQWRSLGAIAEELELLVSLDDGRQYDVRVSPELVGGVCRYVWDVPNLPVSNARLRLRARIGGREVCGPEGTPFSIIETPLRPLERWTFRKGEWWVDEHGRPFDAPGLGSRDQGPSFRAGCPCPPADEPVRAPFDVVPASSRLLSASDATGAVPAVAPHPVPLSRSLPRRE